MTDKFQIFVQNYKTSELRPAIPTVGGNVIKLESWNLKIGNKIIRGLFDALSNTFSLKEHIKDVA